VITQSSPHHLSWSTKSAYVLRNSIVCLGMLPALAVTHAQTAEEQRSTLAYVNSLQQADGGFAASRDRAGKTSRSSLRATLSAVRVMNYFRGELRRRADCAKFVMTCFDKEAGGFGDYPGGKPDALTTALGVMAVVDLKIPVQEYRERALKYLADQAKSFEEVSGGGRGSPARQAGCCGRLGQATPCHA